MKSTLIIIFIFTAHLGLAQSKTDTLYIKSYPQKISVRGFVGTDFMLLSAQNKIYSPNTPLLVGVGFSMKNTVFNARVNYGIVPLNGKEYGKSKVTDLQIHNYRKNFIVDLFFQNYKGFYYSDKNREHIELYPQLQLIQVGAETSYLFNGQHFSARAAFEASEQQLKTAGSFVVGASSYYYKLGLDENFTIKNNGNYMENLQLGFNTGYAYSWVINSHWLMSGMATVGANFGNSPQLLKNGSVNIYPTAFARSAATFHKSNWAVSMSMLIHNKGIHYFKDEKLTATTLNLELTYVQHLDRISKKKKKEL